MIKEFSYNNKNGISFRINLNGEYVYFKEDYKDKFSNFFDGSQKGMSWLYDNKLIEIWSHKGNVKGWPSIDMLYIVAVYFGDEAEYQPPANAVIYNADGSIHKILELPLLISEAAKKCGLYKKQPDKSFHFSNVQWKKDKNGNTVLVMEISETMGYVFKEYRILNPETGEFGECYDSRLEYR